ncbi:hypothetical protein D3C80_1510690 [compost metagenome]
MLDQKVAGKESGHGRDIGFHQAMAERAPAIDFLQVGLAHHAPAVRRTWQLEGNALANHRNVPVVRVTGIRHEQVGASTDGLAYAGVQLLGRRVGKAQLQFGVALDLHGLPGGVHSAFEVFTVGERTVLET